MNLNLRPTLGGLHNGLLSGGMRDLYRSGERGLVLDPSVLRSLYQDSAGTVPVTAPGQPVGRVLDQSGRANHATQSISAARPTYARHPSSGKRQLWTNTDFAGAVSGTPGTAPTGWTWGLTGGSSAVSADAGGNGSAITITTNSNRQYLANATSIQVAANTVLVSSVRCDVLSGSVQVSQVLLFVGAPAGSSVSYRINGVVVAGTSFLPITNNVLVEVILTNGATAGAVTNNRLGLGVAGSVTGSVRFYRPQIELNTATNYQKATSIYDVTEAGFADVWYLSDDNVDDYMTTVLPAGSYTVAYIDGAGVTVTTGQSISGAYSIPGPSRLYGLVVINRALSASETSRLRAWLNNKRP